MRAVKIVATVGPATSAPNRLEELLRAGVDVVRLNFAHGTHEEHARVVQAVRVLAASLQRPVGVLQDLGGPKIRIGDLTGQTITLTMGSEITITTKPVTGTPSLISTTYVALPQDVKPGDSILLADGAVALRVKRVNEDSIEAVVLNGGVVAAHQGISVPGVQLSAPTLSEKDRLDLAFGVDLGVDYVGLSFLRDPADIREARQIIAARGGDTRVIAKLEKREAIAKLDAIIASSDGVMVARGDLGVEFPIEEVPVLQKTIIRKANERGIPVITATQMLESMIHSPRPTRAEVSDVANAILDGTDAVMLSGETAVGDYPIAAVETMVRVAEATRPNNTRPHGHKRMPSHADAIGHAATELAEDVEASAIVVFTRSGSTARIVSRERPAIPIVALTDDERVYRRLSLLWGVTPVLTEFQEHTDAMLEHAQRVLLGRDLVHRGEHVVVVGSSPLVAESRANFLKLQQVR